MSAYSLGRLSLRLARGNLAWIALPTAILFSTLAALALLAAFLDGTLGPDWKTPGRALLSHYGTWSNLLGMPVLFLLTMYFVRTITRVLDSDGFLSRSDSPEKMPESLGILPEDIYAQLACKKLEYKAILILMRVVGLYALVVNAQYTRIPESIYGSDVWDSSRHPFGYIIGRLILGVEWIYVYPTSIYILLVGSIVVTRLAKAVVESDHVRVSPFAPDGCGGFRALGECMLAATYLTLPPIAMVVAHGFTHVHFYATLALASAFAVLIVCAELFLPFIALHRFLVRWKRDYLARLQQRMAHYLDVSKGIESTAVPYVRLLADVQLLDRTRAMSTWPYSPADRLRWLSPVVPVAASLAIKVFWG